jgi:microcystin-dependent protein
VRQFYYFVVWDLSIPELRSAGERLPRQRQLKEEKMGTPFIGEIKIISWNFAPRGWAFANGQLLPINQNQALFSLLGTTYGGDGRVNFALPNLQGRVPLHFGNSFNLGQTGGEIAHTLNMSEMPAHNHIPMGTSTAANTGIPTNNTWAKGAQQIFFLNPGAVGTMSPAAITNTGGSQPHQNLSPYLVLNFIIALQGAFPSQN